MSSLALSPLRLAHPSIPARRALALPPPAAPARARRYWNKGKARKEKNYVAPTSEGEISPREWLAAAAAVERETEAEERAQLPSWWFAAAGSAAAAARAGVSEAVAPPRARAARTMHYMRASTDHRNRATNPWIARDLPLFDAAAPAAAQAAAKSAEEAAAAAGLAEEVAFFLVDDDQQRGVHCRFGMPGIIAEAHYDSGRNVISMQRGRKRYVLSPPQECANLHLLKVRGKARRGAATMPRPAPVLAPPSQSRRHARSRPITHKLSRSLALMLLFRPLPLPLLPPPSPPLLRAAGRP